MKRVTLLSVTVIVLMFFTVPANAFEATGKLGLGFNGGLSIPAGGDITTDSTFSDFFDLGPAFGVHVNYGIIKEVSIETGFRYAFMKMKDDVNDDPENEPNVVVPQIYLNGILNLGSFFNNPENRLNPFVKAGVALVPWKATDDGPGGDAIIMENGEEFKKTSFGLNFGAGLEVYATPNLSLFAEGQYLMIFSEDKDKFGEEFGNLGDININVGLTYYIPLTGM
nr:porin family protein [candidate division Zixibacteria bacterium]